MLPRVEPDAHGAVVFEKDLCDRGAHEHAPARAFDDLCEALGDARGATHWVPAPVLHVCQAIARRAEGATERTERPMINVTDADTSALGVSLAREQHQPKQQQQQGLQCVWMTAWMKKGACEGASP